MHFAKRGAYRCLASDVIEKDELKLSQWPGKKKIIHSDTAAVS